MLALISLFIVIFISIIIIKIAAIALALTGLSEEIASFQALSAFTGAGFTTSESETIIKHPIRRKIAMFLMMLGSAGLTTVVASLVCRSIQICAPYTQCHYAKSSRTF